MLPTDRDARILVLIGGRHAGESPMPGGVKSTRTRLDEAGIATATVHITGGTQSTPRILTDAAQAAGAAGQEFMLNLRGYQQSRWVGAGNANWVIHLPQHGNTGGPLGLGPTPWNPTDTWAMETVGRHHRPTHQPKTAHDRNPYRSGP